MSLISLCTQAEVVRDANKVAILPPQGGGLRAQSGSVHKLRSLVTRINLPLDHLKEVACELNFALYPS